jgi:hypothetical protein
MTMPKLGPLNQQRRTCQSSAHRFKQEDAKAKPTKSNIKVPRLVPLSQKMKTPTAMPSGYVTTVCHRYAEVCHSMSQYVKVCHSMSRYVTGMPQVCRGMSRVSHRYVTGMPQVCHSSMPQPYVKVCSTVCHRCVTTANRNVLKVRALFSFLAVSRTAPGWGTQRCWAPCRPSAWSSTA